MVTDGTSRSVTGAAPGRIVLCAVCGADAALTFADHPGYRRGTSFDVYTCATCNTAQARPCTVDSAIYDEIYRHAEVLPGYERYRRYRNALQRELDSPLDFLAAREDVYWAVRQCLQTRGGPTARLRILEAGSGLGYLTYALADAGYDVVGIDISIAAVEQARSAFGDHFEHAGIAEFVTAHKATFDIVIMTELIEHLPRFKDVLRDALGALRPGGELVVTTPNRTSFAPDAIWATENPPVHLWWFSEDSMRAVARELGCRVSFVDFKEFNRARTGPGGFIEGRRQRRIPFYPPALDEDGRPTPVSTVIGSQRPRLRRTLDSLGLSRAALFLRYRVHKLLHGQPRRRANMCAVLSRDL